MTIEKDGRNVNARQAVTLIRSSMTNVELLHRLKISPKGFSDLLSQLFQKKLIGEEDLKRRGLRFKILKKEQIAAVPIKPSPASWEDDEYEFPDTVVLTDLLTPLHTDSLPPKLRR